MPIAAALATLKSEIAQCDSLIANAHRTEASGLYLFTIRDREQITVAAFLNMFISWEAFLEATILNLMLGCSTVGSGSPIRRVLPANLSDARSMIKGTSRYFDYGNHDYMRTLARLYFENGYPFEPHLSPSYSWGSQKIALY